MIKRILQPEIEKRLFKGKALLILGPRQAGKSTLVEAVLETRERKISYSLDSNLYLAVS